MRTVTDRDKFTVMKALEGGESIVIAIDSAGVHLRRSVSVVHRDDLGEAHYHTTPLLSLPVDAKFRRRLGRVLCQAPQLPAYYLAGGGGWFVIRAQNKPKAHSTGVEEFGRGGVEKCRRATDAEIEQYRRQRGCYEETLNAVIYRRRRKRK